ncbi:MAG: hypothetical protein ACMXYF_00910 [Candidatus Woesearchaeota archaeon]
MVKKMTKWNYVEPFLFTRDALHLQDISRQVGENHTTVRNILNAFAQEGFLKMSQKGRLTLYEINSEFSLLIDYLSVAEKEFLIKKTKNPLLKELISDLHKLTDQPLLLFGSTVIDFSKARDIDILCLEKIEITSLEKKYRKKIHFLRVNNLKEIQLPLKQEIQKKHIIVSSVEQVVKWLL